MVLSLLDHHKTTYSITSHFIYIWQKMLQTRIALVESGSACASPIDPKRPKAVREQVRLSRWVRSVPTTQRHLHRGVDGEVRRTSSCVSNFPLM